MALLPFQTGEDAFAGLVQFLPPIAAIVLLVGLMMWLLAWMSRYFEYLKTLESRWLDHATLDFVRRVLEGVWIAFMAIVVLAIAQTQSAPLHDALVAFVLRVPALFFAIFVVFLAAILVRVIHRFAAFLRGELKSKPKRIAPPRALAFTEIVLKYLIYIASLAIAALGAIRILPPGDQTYFDLSGLPTLPSSFALEIVVAVLLVIVADRFVDSIFEDLKRRTAKFSARVIDEFKSITRYAVWIIGAVVLLFVLMVHVLPADRLVVFAVGFIAFLLVILVLAFDPVRNALAGVTLMRADPFDVGNRVKIGNDLVCDVVSMSLTLTQVRTLRGEVVNIPNTQLLREPILNFSRSKPYAMSVELALGFEVPHHRVREILVRAARDTEGVVPDPSPQAFGKELAGAGIVYQLLAYTDRPERMKEVKSDLIFRIQDALRAEGLVPRDARTD